VKTEAIRCAIKLHSEPELLARFNDPFRKLPRGVTELLRLVSSDGALKKISSINHLDADRFKEILLSYIQTILLQDNNSDLRILGLTSSDDKTQCKLHYKLLMNIFHPDKINSNTNQHHYTQIISQAYKNIKRRSPNTIVTNKYPPNTSVKSNDFQLPRFERHFELKRKTLVIKKHLTKPIISLFLIVIFTTIVLFITSSPPQLIVKKQIISHIISKN
jgi:hypothetical protein